MNVQHLFIINPVAGKKDMSQQICRQVQLLNLKEPYSIKFTKGAGDAHNIAKAAVSSTTDFVRIYSCGGDGTLNEVLNGVHGFSNCAIGVVPVGSGNDFARAFEVELEVLLNLEEMTKGIITEVDLIKCGKKVSINVVSVGYDCAVAKNMVRFKNLPMVSGSMAYKISIMYCLFSNMKNYFSIVADGELLKINGLSYLLAVAGNGKYYGGGIKATPYANLCDNKIELVCIPTISVFTLLRLLNIFIKGEHINNPKIPFVKYKQCRQIDFISNEPIDIGFDGEIHTIKNPSISILSKAQKVIVPRSAKDFIKGSKNTVPAVCLK